MSGGGGHLVPSAKVIVAINEDVVAHGILVNSREDVGMIFCLGIIINTVR